MVTGRQAYSRLTDDKRVIYYHELPTSTLSALLPRSTFSIDSDGLDVFSTIHGNIRLNLERCSKLFKLPKEFADLASLRSQSNFFEADLVGVTNR